MPEPTPSAEALAVVDAIGSPSWTAEQREKLARELDAFAATERRRREQAEQALEKSQSRSRELAEWRDTAVASCAKRRCAELPTYDAYESLKQRAERAEAERDEAKRDAKVHLAYREAANLGVDAAAEAYGALYDEFSAAKAERDARPTVEAHRTVVEAARALSRAMQNLGWAYLDGWAELGALERALDGSA